MKKEKVNQNEPEKKLLFDFFMWFRENGERCPGMSVEAMIDGYLKQSKNHGQTEWKQYQAEENEHESYDGR
ncbi:MAG: hypothetical protein LBK58_05415 [Prevotellaceae bacterium]|jgi:hypothetical protein|nr:hypothetical protein [Prevotellaceae bacterium]